MTFESDPQVLRVTGLTELNASNAAAFRDQARAALQPNHTRLDLDFAQLRFLDSSGLGALLSLHKILRTQGGILKLLNPSAAVTQLIELTRLHRVFEIVHA